jgi:hypothetical protein
MAKKHFGNRPGERRGARLQSGFLSQRTWGIVAVLCALLAVPFWWAKKVNQKTAQEVAVANGKTGGSRLPPGETAADADSGSAVSSMGPAASPDRFGLSFGHLSPAGVPAGVMVSACSGEPSATGNPDKGQCNPYQGDASCRTALPVLCVLKDGSTAESAGLVNEPKADGVAVGFDFYSGWAGGSLGATAPVAGFVLGSLAQANARCTAELGPGWRMATFHDGAGGWGLVGKSSPSLTSQATRHWVHIGDQKANCWDTETK